jgi:hypothetical protein
LPRIPIKETEKRSEAFEQRHGEGATELDALEALHPGVLARILEQEIGRYRLHTAAADHVGGAASPTHADRFQCRDTNIQIAALQGTQLPQIGN